MIKNLKSTKRLRLRLRHMIGVCLLLLVFSLLYAVDAAVQEQARCARWSSLESAKISFERLKESTNQNPILFSMISESHLKKYQEWLGQNTHPLDPNTCISSESIWSLPNLWKLMLRHEYREWLNFRRQGISWQERSHSRWLSLQKNWLNIEAELRADRRLICHSKTEFMRLARVRTEFERSCGEQLNLERTSASEKKLKKNKICTFENQKRIGAFSSQANEQFTLNLSKYQKKWGNEMAHEVSCDAKE